MKQIDQIDERILRILEQDGRISNTELAEKVHLSPSACLRRVQELERQGIIKGYRAVLDRRKIGGGFQVFVSIAISEHQRSALDEFERAMKRHPEIRECYNVTGGFEYLLLVDVADLNAYKDFHTEVIGQLSMVRTITSYVVMDAVKNIHS